MPRYFFHVRGGPRAAEDLVGTELADPAAARRHAERLAADIVASEVIEGRPAEEEERLVVMDEEQRIVFELPHLAEAAPQR